MRVSSDCDGLGCTSDGPVRILQTVSSDRAHHSLAGSNAGPAACFFTRPATPAAEAGSTKTPSCEDRMRYIARISRSVTSSMTPPDWSRASRANCHEAGLPIRIAVATVEGLGTTSRDDRRCPGSLEPPHARIVRAHAVMGVLGVTLPVSGDVARISYRQAVNVWSVSQLVDDFERGSLLAFDTNRVNAVHQGHGVVLRQGLASELKAVVEVSIDLQQSRAMRQRLRHLA